MSRFEKSFHVEQRYILFVEWNACWEGRQEGEGRGEEEEADERRGRLNYSRKKEQREDEEEEKEERSTTTVGREGDGWESGREWEGRGSCGAEREEFTRILERKVQGGRQEVQ